MPVKKSGDYYVAKSNELIQRSQYTLSLKENKLLLYLISKIKPDDMGDELYHFSVRDFCRACNIDQESGFNHNDVKRALSSIASKSLWISTANGTDVLIRWLNIVRYDRKSGMFEVSFHEDIIPYLYELRATYTQYALENILPMSCKYGIRLYELLKSYEYIKRPIEFSIDELRKRLDATRKYERYADFRRNVLEPAVDDVNHYTDIYVSYQPIEGPRAEVEQMEFSITKPRAMDAQLRRLARSRALYGDKRYRDK